MVAFCANSDGLAFMALDVRVARKHSDRVARLDAAGCCVCCNLPADDRRLGRCGKCYYRYRNQRLQLPLDKRPVLDAKLIRAGQLIPSRQGQRLTSRGA